MTVSLGQRACATIFPVTLALAASAPVTSFSSSLCTASTSAKVTLAPTLPARRSTLMVSPGATRYCLPPLRMTAYMKPPDASGNHHYTGGEAQASNAAGDPVSQDVRTNFTPSGLFRAV